MPIVSLRARLNPALVNEDFPEPVIYVSGCTNETVSNIIKGQYTAKGCNHGKPFYERVSSPSAVRALIYFWDSRDGPSFRGWWFAPKLGSEMVWAFNSSNRGPGDLTVPKSGWRAPWDGAVDETLTITTDKTARVDKTNNTPFKLRWEFDASAHGEKDGWQPVSQEMNDALEKRWLEGWQGDNGTDVFHVHSSGPTYAVDCYSMVQWNVKTHRRRHIRRGEVRPDLPELTAKAAQAEQLQTERNKLMEEKTELSAKVAKLEFLAGT